MLYLLLLAVVLVPHALCLPNLLLPKSISSGWGKAGPGGSALIPPGKGGVWGYITVREGAHMFWSGLLLHALHAFIVHAGKIMPYAAGGLSPAENATMRLWMRSHSSFGCKEGLEPVARAMERLRFSSLHAVLCLSAVAQPVQMPLADLCCYASQEIGPYMIGFRERKHNWASRANLLFIDNPVGTGFSYVEPHANFCESLQPHIKLLPAFQSVQWTTKALPS